MKISKEKVMGWNKKMGQGFTTDVNYLVMHGEKCPHLYVDIPEQPGQMVEIELMYQDEVIRKTNEYGVTYPVYTGKKIPTAHVCKWIDEGTFRKSFGIGKWVPVGAPQDRALFSTLQKLTHTIDIDKLYKMGIGEPDTMAQSSSII